MDILLEAIGSIAKYFAWWGLLIAIFVIYYLYTKKEYYEEYLAFKLIGFYILGCFTFTVHNIEVSYLSIPVGFIIYILSMKNKDRLNKTVKEKAVYLGLLIWILGLVTSFIYNSIEYRDITVNVSNNKVEYIKNDFEKVKDKLNLNGDTLESFSLFYDKNNNIESLNYTISDENKRYFIYKENNKYKVDVTKKYDNESNQWFGFDYEQNNYGISVNEFMKIISKIKFAKNKNEIGKNIVSYNVEYRYGDQNTGSSMDYGDNIYYIDDVERMTYKKAEKRQLPIEGIKITYTPMEKVETGSSSTNSDSYVYYPNFNKQLINSDTEKLTIKEGNSIIEYENNSNTIYDILNSLEFDFWEETDYNHESIQPSIIIKDNSGVSLYLYKDKPYAKYEYENEKAYYNIPSEVYNNIKEIIK